MKKRVLLNGVSFEIEKSYNNRICSHNIRTKSIYDAYRTQPSEEKINSYEYWEEFFNDFDFYGFFDGVISCNTWMFTTGGYITDLYFIDDNKNKIPLDASFYITRDHNKIIVTHENYEILKHLKRDIIEFHHIVLQ